MEVRLKQKMAGNFHSQLNAFFIAIAILILNCFILSLTVGVLYCLLYTRFKGIYFMMPKSLDQVTQQLANTTVKSSGVSFKCKSLKLDSEEDCKEVVKAIAACPDLQYLNLEGNTVGVDAARAIAKALETKGELKRALWKDMFTGRMKTEIPMSLQYLGSGLALAGACLTELDLSDNAFGPIGVEGLAGLLSSHACYQLKELRLNNNGLGISGGKMLANALLECHKKSTAEGKSLALRLFVAGRNRLENKGAKALSKLFQTLGTLEEISMPQNGIYHPGIKFLCESFIKNPNLQVLDLNDNTLTKKGSTYMADALPYLQKLKSLNLGDCLLKTGGAKILAQALTWGHTYLEELNLVSNEIGSAGGLAIVSAMKNKNNLKSLTLDNNMFGVEGIRRINEELKKSGLINSHSTITLTDDEGDDEYDDEEDDEDERDEESASESDTENKPGTPEIGNITKRDDDTTKLSSFLQNLSVASHDVSSKTSEVGDPFTSFLNNPSADNFLRIERKNIDDFLLNNKEPSTEFYIDTFIPTLMKISSLSSSKNDQVKILSLDISLELYENLFGWAFDQNKLSTINNSLFVHLGLIKSEDKDFKVKWSVEACLSALKKAISRGLVPGSTQQILECCLEREITNNKCEEIVLS